jgi:hypothetical protein
MKIKLFIFIILLLSTIAASGEAIFLKDGSILEGKIIKETDKYVEFKMKNNLQTKIPRKRIIRTLYHDNYKNKVYIKMFSGSVIQGYIVFDNKKEYTVRKKLYNKKEFKISIKKVNGVLKKMPSSGDNDSNDSSEEMNDFSQKTKMAVTAGIGYSTGTMIDHALPLEFGFDYAITPAITIGFDGYYWPTSSNYHSSEFDLSIHMYQYGTSSKFWLNKAFDGIYIGALFAQTHTKTETLIVDTISISTTIMTMNESYNTLGFKAGYVVDAGRILLDFGARYDAVDFEFGDAFFTGYVAAGIKF